MTQIRSFMKALRSPSLGKVLLGLVAFSVTEWAAYIALAALFTALLERFFIGV